MKVLNVFRICGIRQIVVFESVSLIRNRHFKQISVCREVNSNHFFSITPVSVHYGIITASPLISYLAVNFIKIRVL